MTLKEAIEAGERAKLAWEGLIPPEELAAMTLLIEAGKRVQDCRQVICDFAPVLLPGETKE